MVLFGKLQLIKVLYSRTHSLALSLASFAVLGDIFCVCARF